MKKNVGQRLGLEKLFSPTSVAVIGASNSPEKVGYALVRNLIDADYSGEIIPINLHESTVQGIKAFKSINDVKRQIDTVLISIPAQFVPQTLKDCANKGIKNAIIITAGFSETGLEGKALEDELRKISEEHSMNIVGPNTLGVINTEN